MDWTVIRVTVSAQTGKCDVRVQRLLCASCLVLPLREWERDREREREREGGRRKVVSKFGGETDA